MCALSNHKLYKKEENVEKELTANERTRGKIRVEELLIEKQYGMLLRRSNTIDIIKRKKERKKKRKGKSQSSFMFTIERVVATQYGHSNE